MTPVTTGLQILSSQDFAGFIAKTAMGDYQVSGHALS
jgi:hypothetical protein